MKKVVAWGLAATWFLGLGIESPPVHAVSTAFSPEANLFLTHNDIFRSRIVTSMNWSETDEVWSNGTFEYTVDFSLKSFFRRYVYKDPNPDKGKVFTVRLGYAYLPAFAETPNTLAEEHRGVAELYVRLPLGGRWLLTDRNRGDLRFIGDATSGRYRNKLQMERSMAFMGFRGTPYASAEGFYDTAVDRWNRFEAKGGIELPWRYSTVFEVYFSHMAVWKGEASQTVGFVIQKHMAMPLGGTQ